MKLRILIPGVLLFVSVILSAQVTPKEEVNRIPLLGEPAPSFTAQTTKGKMNFPDDYFQKWKILFSHPGDFTPVCSTELLELAALQDDFDKLNVKLVVMSTDGLNSHLEWIRSLESLTYNGKGPFKINFPLVSDPTLEISKKYGMVSSQSPTTRDVRGVFIIDTQDRVQAIFFYPTIVGRNIDEIKRTLIAVQTAAENRLLTPANWQPGQPVLIPSPESSNEARKLAEKNDPDLYSLTWYLWFKKMP